MSDQVMARGRIGAAALLAATCLWLAGAGAVRADTDDAEQVRILVHSLADGGPGSLRQAIVLANGAASDASVTIAFDILACHGPCTLRPATVLPTISHDRVTIDGYSQIGAREATPGMPASLAIEIDGTRVTNNGLNIISTGNVVKGLSIHGFAWSGIAIGGPDARGNLVSGNHIGLGPAGDLAPGNGFSGVYIALGAHQNGVGGPLPSQRNVIAGNGWEGVGIHGENTHDNIVLGNFIGTNAAGDDARPNTLDGVRIYGKAYDNRIGLILPDVEPQHFGNLISGNVRDGVRIAGEGSHGNRLWGNTIGTARNGAVALPNGGHGVHVLDGATGATIGGGTGVATSLISGNGGDGVRLDGADASHVFGNHVGTDAAGALALPNVGDGVAVMNAQDVVVGGTGPGERNLISGNGRNGVLLSGSGTSGALVQSNRIGTTVTGGDALPNALDGIQIDEGAHDNSVGLPPLGPPVGARLAAMAPSGGNLISGNGGSGVEIEDSGTQDNSLFGNKIGTDADGMLALGNGDAGVFVRGGAQRTSIGSRGAGYGNVIAGNQVGIAIFGSGTSQTSVTGNLVGIAIDGVSPLGNSLAGISIQDSATMSLIGPGNTIAFSGENGVLILGAGTLRHEIFITSIHHNGQAGIRLGSGANGHVSPPTATLWRAGERRLEGTTCAGCRVEAFANADDDGEGERPIARVVAEADGTFSTGLPSFDEPYLTLTATDPELGTSAFSRPFRPASLAPPATSTSTASPTARPPATGTPTPTWTSTVTATPSSPRTSSPTALPTSTPMPSAMPSATRIASPTPTSSATATVRPTATAIPVPSQTARPTDGSTPVPRTATPRPSTTATRPPSTSEATPTGGATVTPGPALPWSIHLPLGLRGVSIAGDSGGGGARVE